MMAFSRVTFSGSMKSEAISARLQLLADDAMVHGLTAVGLSTQDVLWSCPLVGWSIFSVTVSDEAIYFATDEDYFYALDLLTGRQLWRHQLQVFEAYQLIPTSCRRRCIRRVELWATLRPESKFRGSALGVPGGPPFQKE